MIIVLRTSFTFHSFKVSIKFVLFCFVLFCHAAILCSSGFILFATHVFSGKGEPGRLKLCSNSIIFVPSGTRIPILKFPFEKIKSVSVEDSLFNSMPTGKLVLLSAGLTGR